MPDNADRNTEVSKGDAKAMTTELHLSGEGTTIRKPNGADADFIGFTLSEAPADPLEGIAERSRIDRGAPFADEILTALSKLRKQDPAAYEVVRGKLKASGVRVRELDKMVQSNSKKGDSRRHRSPSEGDTIIAAAIAGGMTFWRDVDSTAFATVRRDGRIERYRAQSKVFSNVVRTLYGRVYTVNSWPGADRPASISESGMREAILAFEAMSFASADVREPEVRVCRDNRGIWLDLGDPDWRLVLANDRGWRIVDDQDVPLIRAGGMRELPAPTPTLGNSPLDRDDRDRLARLFNLTAGDGSERSLQLALAWLVSALWPRGPYAVLALDGEQGSGKTTVATMLRRLVDPNRAPLRGKPRSEDDLIVAAENGRIVALDNMSDMDPWLADAICRVATGAGLSKRKLFTDGEEHIAAVCRPVLLNGIPSLLARGDLADRAIPITLSPIADTARRPDSDVWAEFVAASPGILSALLDALALALRDESTLYLPRLPRMANFARVACAAAPAFGWTALEMLAAIEGNREIANEAVLAADPIAEIVQDLAAPERGWSGNATEMLARINNSVPPGTQRGKGWPKDGARLSTRLRRLSPALRRSGVEVALPTKGGRAGRVIEVRRTRP